MGSTCTYRRRRLRPRGRAVERAAVGKRHHVRQLAPRRQVARDVRVVGGVVHEVRWPVASWIVHKNWLFQLKADNVNWGYVVGVAGDEYIAIRIIPECVGKKGGGQIDIRPLFLEFHHVSHTVSRFPARLAFLRNVWKPYLVSIVVAFHDTDKRLCRKCLEIDVLSCDRLCIIRIWTYASSEEIDGNNVMSVAKQPSHKRGGIKPSTGRVSMEKAIVEVESIDICNGFLHRIQKLQGPLAFRLEALPRIARGSRSDVNPSRGSLGSVSNRWVVRKGGFGRK